MNNAETAATVPTAIPLGYVSHYQRGFVLNFSRGWVIWRTVTRGKFYAALYDRDMLAVLSNPDDTDVLLVSGLTFRDGRHVWRARKI